MALFIFDSTEEEVYFWGREWVLQRYIEKPLLLRGHKFHIRTYVLCVGALKVFVFEKMLLLLAAHPYVNLLSSSSEHLFLINCGQVPTR